MELWNSLTPVLKVSLASFSISFNSLSCFSFYILIWFIASSTNFFISFSSVSFFTPRVEFLAISFILSSLKRKSAFFSSSSTFLSIWTFSSSISFNSYSPPVLPPRIIIFSCSFLILAASSYRAAFLSTFFTSVGFLSAFLRSVVYFPAVLTSVAGVLSAGFFVISFWGFTAAYFTLGFYLSNDFLRNLLKICVAFHPAIGMKPPPRMPNPISAYFFLDTKYSLKWSIAVFFQPLYGAPRFGFGILSCILSPVGGSFCISISPS